MLERGGVMNFWDSQAFGIIIGSFIAGVFALLAQIFAERRQKKQFAHDLEVRREQFSHEREQEIRGRQTEALADLCMLLEAQATALGNLWAFIRNPQMRPELTIPPKDAWTVLRDRGYRIKLWPINVPLTKAVNEYGTKIHKLFERLIDPQVSALVAGDDVNLDVKLVGDLNQRFQAASKPLSTALKETANLMSELNGIQVRKMTDQQVPVEKG